MHTEDPAVVAEPAPRPEDAFRKLLLQFSNVAATGASPTDLVQQFCRSTREFFQVDGAYFWRLATPEELVGAEADGLMAEGFRGLRLKARDSTVAAEAVRQRKTVYINQVDPGRYPMAAEFHAQSVMATPLMVSNEVVGAAVFLSASQPDLFNENLAAQATILAGQLGNLLEALHFSQAAQELSDGRRRSESISGLALELNSQLRLPQFAQSLVTRAAELMNAQVGALLMNHGEAFETVALHGMATLPSSILHRFEHALSNKLAEDAGGTLISSAAEMLGSELSASLGWRDSSLVRLRSPSGEVSGVLCLANRGKPLDHGEQQLLQAIAAHASVALEHARLFTRMDQANRHWVEIFDAITDFIVAHDQTDNVLRVNRSLADFIGIPPQRTDRSEDVRAHGDGR